MNVLNEGYYMEDKTTSYTDMLEKMWEEGKASSHSKCVDVSDELNYLLRIYVDGEKSLREREEMNLVNLTTVMKRYLDSKTERQVLSQKIENLKAKMQRKDDQQCGEDE